MAGWDTGKPIYDRLPGENEGYRVDGDPTNAIAYWLTEHADTLLMESKGSLDDFYTDFLNPATARIDALDWLAQLAGFTGEYWDAAWPVAVKRLLIANAYDFIWPDKGSRYVLEWLIVTFGLQAQLYMLGEFLADINKAGDLLGGELLEFYLRVSLAYLRTSPEWALLEKLRVLYTPVYTISRVCYERFYAGFSIAGDPVFTE